MLKVLPSVNVESPNYFTLINTILYLDNYHKFKNTTERVVDNHTAYRYQGNFYGLLNELNIPSRFHILILYFNGYTSPVQYDGKVTSIRIPNTTLIENLMNMYENN